MGNYKNRTVLISFPHALKDLNQVLKTPEVDSRLRLIKDGQSAPSGKYRRDFDTFQFSAGKARVDFPPDIVSRAEPYFRQICAGIRNGKLPPGCNSEQINHFKPFEPHRLLKSITDSHLRALRNAFFRNIDSVQINPAGSRLFYSRNQFGQRRFTAAVWSGNHRKFVILYCQTDIADNFFLVCFFGNFKRNIS